MRSKRRIVLGVGYPWFGASEDKYVSVVLHSKAHGQGETIPLIIIRNAGAWKKLQAGSGEAKNV